MKYLSIFRFVKHYFNSVLGKLGGLVITPLVFPHRDWIRNYAWNYMRVNRTSSSGVNAKLRIYFNKDIIKTKEGKL